MLYNIAFFLVVAAIVIAVVKPKSKIEVWLYSIIIPFFLVFWVALFDSFFSDTNSQTSYKLASAFGESLVSIIVSIPTLFFYLRKKLIASNQFKFPKGIIIAIGMLIVLELCLEWGQYKRGRALERTKIENNDSKGVNYQTGKKENELHDEQREISNEAIDARKILPELVAFINQGLPVSKEGMTMNSMEVKNNSVVVSLIIDENIINFDKTTNDINSNKQDFFQLINANNQQIINKIILAEYDYIVEIKASNSRKTRNIILSAKELKSICNSKKSIKETTDHATLEARKIVQQDIESTNKKLPITEAGFSLTQMEIKDNALVAYFEIDENELNFEDYIRHLERNKGAYFMQSTGHNPIFMKNMLLSDYDWTLILKAKQSGKTKKISMSADELEEAVINFKKVYKK